MSRFYNNRGGFGMNFYQPRRGGGPGGPMRGGLMGNPNFRTHPFINDNQNRRGGNNNNFNRAQTQQESPQKQEQTASAPLIPPPSPGPALTMKAPVQTDKPADPQKPSTPVPKFDSPPPKPVTPSPQPNQQLKSPSGPVNGQKPQPSPKPAASPLTEPQPSPKQEQKPGPQQAQKSGTTQPGQGTGTQPSQGPGPQQGQRAGPQPGQGSGAQQGQRAGPQPGQGAGPQPGQGAGPQPGQGAGPQPGQGAGPQPGQGAGPQPGQGAGAQQGQGAGAQQGQRAGPQPGQGAGPQQGQRAGPQPGQGSGAQQGQRTGPQQGQISGAQQGQRTGPQQGQGSGAQQGQRTGPQQGQGSGAQQGQRTGPQQGQGSGPYQQQRSGPQQHQRHSPHQNQRSGPHQNQRFGPQQNQRSGPQQSQGSGPPATKPGPSSDTQTPTTKTDEQSKEFKATLSMLLKPGEKSYTQRCRLFVGNLPNDITEENFRKIFAKYGEPSEVFINKNKGFGFIRLESRAIAEMAKAELDDIPMKGRPLRVRFATHSAALSIKNLSPYVSNELLEEAFSQFGMVERAVVIVDDRGRSSGKGIVEFASRPAARKALDRCNEGVFLLTTTPRPVIVEPMEQFDSEDGLPEKLSQKNIRYQAEREEPPRFARPGTFEFEYSKRWKSLDEMEKQQRQQVEKNMLEAREKLESEMDDAFHEHQANMLRQDLLRRQEELRRMEEMHSQEMQKRKELQLRQEEERRRREEELLRKREIDEQMRRQREESFRMGNFIDRDRDIRMHPGTTLAMTDLPFSGSGQNFPLSGLSFDSQKGMGTTSTGLMNNEMRNERFNQGSQRGMVPGNTGFGRVREEFDGPAKKARF